MSGKLGDILVSHGVIDQEKLIAALSDQFAFGGKLGRTLIDLGYVSEEELLRALSEQLGLDTVDLDAAEVKPDALRRLPFDACERYGVFPLRVDDVERVLWVATAEPDRQALQEVAQIAQYTLEPVLASMSSIERAVRRYYFGERTTRTRLGEPLSSIPRDIPLAAPRPRSVPNRSAEAAFPDEGIEADAPVIGSIEPGVGAQDAMLELKTLIIRLESTVNAQSRAFRALVNLLTDKGVVRRGELGQRASKK
jgi:Type II secretion system (T2SS), protein E, N-terminal domain